MEAHRPAVRPAVGMGLVSAAQVAEVLAQADGRDKSLDNLVVLWLLVVAAA